MKKYLIVFILALIFGCNENPISDENSSSDFKLTINVKNSNSVPLSGYTISAWNKIIRQSNILPKEKQLDEINATTSMNFTIPQSTIVDLTVFDIENNIYQKLFSNKPLPADVYKYDFYHQNNIGCGVYKCKLVAKDDSVTNTIIFQDSIYAVMIAPDPEVAKIGITNQNGTYETNKKILFPNLYDLPEFIFTSQASPDPLGSFSLSDEIIIALTNNNSEVKYFSKTISDKENVFDLVWENGSDDYPDWGWFNKVSTTKKILDDSSFVIPNEFKLYQNYPNPFN